MACHQVNNKPLPKPVQANSQLDPLEQTSQNF